MQAAQHEKLGMKQIFSYGIGNLGLNVFFSAISTYLLYFYTDNAGLTAAAAGTLIFLVKLVNLVVNPLMGLFIDRTSSRWGKFRPYILFGSLPLAIVGVLTFTVPNLDPSGKLVYAYVTYILFNIAYSIVNVPYSSLLANMSDDYYERSRISSIKVFLGQIGSMVVATATLPLVHRFSSEAEGFRIVFSAFGVLLLIALLMTFFGTKERVQASVANRDNSGVKTKTEAGHVPFGITLKALARNKYLMLLLVYITFSTMALSVKTSVAVYYFKYNIGNTSLFSIYSLVGFAFLLTTVLINPKAVKKWGKRNTGILSQFILIAGLIGFYVFSDSVTLVFLFGAISYVGLGLSTPLLWSMVPDTIEYGEWKTGVRSEATVYAAFIFAQLLATAIASKLSGDLLEWFGYVPNAAQTPTALHGILIMQTAIPLAAAVIGIIVLYFYKLDNKTFASLKQEIKERGNS